MTSDNDNKLKIFEEALGLLKSSLHAYGGQSGSIKEGSEPHTADVAKFLKKAGVPVPEFIEFIRTQEGDIAWFLFAFAFWGWMKPDEAVEAIKVAPGNRAMALYQCASMDWIKPKDAVALIKEAPGERTRALCWAQHKGWPGAAAEITREASDAEAF